MNTTTFELPRITTLVAVGPSCQAPPASHTPACHDAINRELVRCAQGRGNGGSGRWERWLFAPMIVAGIIGVVAAATTAGQWVIQWPGFVQWAERALL